MIQPHLKHCHCPSPHRRTCGARGEIHDLRTAAACGSWLEVGQGKGQNTSLVWKGIQDGTALRQSMDGLRTTEENQLRLTKQQ